MLKESTLNLKTACTVFPIVSGLNDMFPQNGVKSCTTGFEVFSHLVGVSEVLLNQQQHKEWPQLLRYSLAAIVAMFA